MSSTVSIIVVAGVLLLACNGASAADPASRPSAAWPPQVDPDNKTSHAIDGRLITRYWHGQRPEWGYPSASASEWNYPAPQESGPSQQNHNSFYVVEPQQPRDHAPLCVVMHSANRTAFDYMAYGCLDRKLAKLDDPATTITNPPGDFYALYLNSTNDEWWGWNQVRHNHSPDSAVNNAPPAVLRVMDTIDWVASHYSVDRNRIYLTGVSMGGCGALAVGMSHGDVFAAVRVSVPAGTGYASALLGGIAPSPPINSTDEERAAWIKRASLVGLPDPPVVVDFSSQVDVWSVTQPALVQAAQAGRLPLVLGWGQFGHATFTSLIAKYPLCEIALAFPWTDIRKDEAYVAFTNASCDQRCPWLNAPPDYDDSGQLNAYFRWKSQTDTPTELKMQIWIDHPAIKGTPPAMPDSATADVTLRRVQHFKVNSGQRYRWKMTRDGHELKTGTVVPDASNLLTFPDVDISTTPADLALTPLN